MNYWLEEKKKEHLCSCLLPALLYPRCILLFLISMMSVWELCCSLAFFKVYFFQNTNTSFIRSMIFLWDIRCILNFSVYIPCSFWLPHLSVIKCTEGYWCETCLKEVCVDVQRFWCIVGIRILFYGIKWTIHLAMSISVKLDICLWNF